MNTTYSGNGKFTRKKQHSRYNINEYTISALVKLIEPYFLYIHIAYGIVIKHAIIGKIKTLVFIVNIYPILFLLL